MKKKSKIIVGGEHLKKAKLDSGEYISTFGMEIECGSKIKKKDQLEAYKKYEEIEKFRGWIVAETNTIEHFLELIITNSLFQPDENIKQNLFNEFVLKQRFFTLWEKRSLIRGILKSDLLNEVIDIDKSTLKTFRTNLQTLIERRNEFGHNSILIRMPSLLPIMKGSKNGNEFTIELTEDYLDKIKKTQKDVLEITMELNKQVKEKS